MVGFNKVMLMGNLTRDPQVRTLPNQTVLAEFGLACNRRYRSADGEERQETTFVDCTAFGRQAEVISEWCRKGKAIFIEGRLKYETWEDRQGGGRRSKLSVVVENFQFLGAPDRAAAGEQEAAPSQPAPTPDDTAKPRQAPQDQRSALRGQAPADAKRPARRREPAGAGFRQSDIPF